MSSPSPHPFRFRRPWFRRDALLVAGVSVLLAAVILPPLVRVLGGAFFDNSGSFTGEWFSAVESNPAYRTGLLHALLYGVSVLVATLLPAFALAWVFDRYDFFGKKFFGTALLAPLVLPPFVGALGLAQVFGRSGAFNAFLEKLGLTGPGPGPDWFGDHRFSGMVVVAALGAYPLAFLQLRAGLAAVDPALDEAAACLGAGPLRRFFKITLPAVRPALVAAGVIAFLHAFTDLGVPLIFRYDRITAVQIFDGLRDIAADATPYALIVVLLVVSAAAHFGTMAVFGRDAATGAGRASRSRTAKKLSPAAGRTLTAGLSCLLALALLPHVAVTLMAFAGDWYRTVLPGVFTTGNVTAALSEPATSGAAVNSLLYSAGAVTLAGAAALAVAWLVVRRRAPGAGALDALAMTPLAVPGIVFAFGFLASSQPGRELAFLAPGGNPVPLLIFAYAVRKLPLLVRAAAAGFAVASTAYEEAGASMGAPPVRTLRRVTLPLVAASLLAGAIPAFAGCLLEVSDSLVLAQKREHYPLAKALYETAGRLGDGPFLACALATWAMAAMAALFWAASSLGGKSRGAFFGGE